MTVEEYGKMDPTFNRSKFIGSVNRMIQNIYIAISFDHIDTIHSYMDDKTYLQLLDRVERMSDGLILKYDNVFIDSEIKEIHLVRGVPTIEVSSTCNFSKYYLENGEIVRGSNEDIIQVLHSFSFRKNQNALPFYRCDGCGASFDMRQEEKCPNCGSSCIHEENDYYIVGMV